MLGNGLMIPVLNEVLLIANITPDIGNAQKLVTESGENPIVDESGNPIYSDN